MSWSPDALEGDGYLRQCTLSPPDPGDTNPAWNGVATSSSPFQSQSQGDEDIAAPNAFPKGAVSRCALFKRGGHVLVAFRALSF
jgi:hypothetical protein